jgi:hypothetical protein
MLELINFFNHPFFIIIGGLATILMIAGFIYSLYVIARGVLPVWYRLGKGLSKRRIAIFSDSQYGSLEQMISDSKIFRKSNIIKINKDDLKKADGETIFLVHWGDYKDKIQEILTLKKDSTALIIYAPQNEGRIGQEEMDKINLHRNSIVVNFRGRLLNDILTSMITTSYEHN